MYYSRIHPEVLAQTSTELKLLTIAWLTKMFSQKAPEVTQMLMGPNLGDALDVDYCGTIVTNADGIITFVNKSFAEIFRLSVNDMIGKHVHEAYVNSSPSRLPVVLETGQPEIGDLHKLNGRIVVVNRYPIYDRGQVVGALGKLIYRDLQEFLNVYKKVNKSAHVEQGEFDVHPSIKYNITNIIGYSPEIQKLKDCINKIAPRSSNVLIRGESGTGKELFAHAIHTASNRRRFPLIKVNCAAIPEHLLESELFGYAEGAFTGAKKGGQKGKFESADKGTIFLDEIGDMSLTMQAKLLRVLQENEITPLGDSKTKYIDVRVIAATNVNLEEQVKNGHFRPDLFFRLNVINLNVPPIRERKEDIGFLVEHFIKKLNRAFFLNVETVSPEVLSLFRRYNWPGNVRELENVMEQAFNFIEGNQLSLEYLPQYLFKYVSTPPDINKLYTTTNSKAAETITLLERLDDTEKELIIKALNASNGNKAGAARILGISRPGLYKKLSKYKIL